MVTFPEASESFELSLAVIMILGGTVAGLAGGAPTSIPTSGPAATASAPTSSRQATIGPKPSEAADRACDSQSGRDIVVCAQRLQGYRLDSDVIDAERETESNNRSTTAPMPPAQGICATQPMGCGKGLQGLDLANAAVVIATTAIKAAKGEDWTGAFKTGGSDEYQLYLQAQHRREAREQQERAEAAARKAHQNR